MEAGRITQLGLSMGLPAFKDKSEMKAQANLSLFMRTFFFFSLIMRSDKDPCTQNVSLYAAVQILIKRSVFILLRFLLSEPLTVQY